MRDASIASTLCIVAAPRAGTTALSRTLGASEAFRNFGEIFHTNPTQRARQPHLFANFAASEKLGLEDFHAATTATEVAARYLAYLRDLAGEKIPLLDIKFNSWQMLRPAWAWPDEEPMLMSMLKERQCAFIFIRRRDLTEQVLSLDVARRSHVWHNLREQDLPAKFDAELSPALALAEAIIRAETHFDRLLRDYPLACPIAYEDLFSADTLAAPLTDFLSRTFGVVSSSLPPTRIRKNEADKRTLISNYEAIKGEVERLAGRLGRASF